MKVSVDAEICTGCELCADNCPEVFEMKDDVSTVKVGKVPKDQEECARTAAQDCPVEAIAVEE